MIRKWSLYWRENGQVKDSGQFYGRENGHCTAVLTLMDI